MFCDISVFCVETNRLLLFGEILAVCCGQFSAHVCADCDVATRDCSISLLVVWVWRFCDHIEKEISVRMFKPLTPNDPYMGRTAPLTSKYFILYIYSTNIGSEYVKHGMYSSYCFIQNAVCFIILM